MGMIIIIGLMFICALVAFVLMSRLVAAQQNGWALSVISVLGAAFVMFWFASTTPIGIDPMLSVSIAFLIALPAFLGGCMGALMGRLLLRRRLRIKS